MAGFLELLDRLDLDPRVRGAQFEHISKWFLKNDPTYKATLRRVWLWDEWPGRWGTDAGIDLVAEDHQGRLWAIQSKAYAADRAVTKADVNTFLAESSRSAFSFRLLIATTDKLHRIARRTIDDQEKQVAFIGLADLLTSEVDWPAAPNRLRPSPPPKPATPRPHQRKAIQDVVDGFAAAERGQLVMACGTGKTLTSLFIRQELDAHRTLVLLPSLSLLKQSMQEWRANTVVPFEALPVCSDDTVAHNADDAVTHTSELGVPVTTDPDEIAAFLRRRSGPRVIFSTYQSSRQIAAAFALGRVPAFDLVVADEAHRVAGNESSVYATVLDSDAIRARRRLFMTATPRYYTGRVRKAAQDADMEVASMDDPTRFGHVLHRLSFGDAIRRDLLTDYQVAIVGVDDATYRDWAQEGTLVSRDGEITDARTLASQIGLAKAMRKYDLHRVISFHSRVARAREFAAELPRVVEWMPARHRPTGTVWTGHASGTMTAGERHVLLQQLRHLDDGGRGLLANARCLSEGVDVPTLDGVAFIDPRRSEVDIVQAVGRAIRKSQDKTVGTIVMPVFIDTDTDPEAALDSSAFKPVWDIIQALRAHDSELGEQLDALRRELGREGGRPRLPDKIHTDLPATVGVDFARAFDVRLVEKTSASWEFWYGLLEKYVADNGTARVPVDYVVDGHRLGQWAANQRAFHAKQNVTLERQGRLEGLPGWSWDLVSDKWETGIRLLKQFVAEHGDANVPYPYVVGEYNLRNWVAIQRSEYRQQRLCDDRIRQLEALRGWSWDLLDDTWRQNYDALKKFVERAGHARVPKRHSESGLNLGNWLAVQRGNREKMAPARRAALEDLLGWSWDPFRDLWESNFAALAEFTEREGHTRVPDSYRVDGRLLGRWVTFQRMSRDKLTAEQQQRLSGLQGWSWDVRADRWHRKFTLLQQFQRREGRALVPLRHVEAGEKLGSWVREQRSNRDTLSAERRALLESVAGWVWDTNEEAWEGGYRALVEFVDREGHARVRKPHVEGGVKLGQWVGEQRSNQDTMHPKRKTRLEALPGWSWNTVVDSWMEHLELLHVFAAKEGHSNVPVGYSANGMKLGQWTRIRRREQKTLTPQRHAELEAVPGWFWGTKSDYTWNSMYELLVKFVAREGHVRVPGTHVEDGVKLGVWVGGQRRMGARAALSGERRSLLESLPGWN